MRILIIGKTGQVASELSRVTWPDDAVVMQMGREQCDLRDLSAIRTALDTAAADIVINAAAYTAVDRAEWEPELAKALNETCPGELALRCARSGAALIHLSTDYVFDGGKHGPYLEDDAINPLSVYGRTKAGGEANIRAVLDRHVILRTSWVFSSRGNNFVKTILKLAREKPELHVVDDQIGAPTAASDIAGAISTLSAAIGEGRARWGTFHFTSANPTSWFGFANAIVHANQRWGGAACPIHPIATADYPTAATRPLNSVLNCERIRESYGINQPSWQLALGKTVAELAEGADRMW